MKSTRNPLVERAAKIAQSGQIEEAISLLTDAASSGSNELDANALLGILLVQSERHREAIAMLNEVVIAEPDNFEARYWLSTSYRKDGQAKLAVQQANSAKNLRPHESQAIANLGFCEYEAGQFTDAAATFASAAALKPNEAFLWHYRGLSLFNLGEIHLAIVAFNRAVDLAPRGYESLIGLSKCYSALDDENSSIAFVRRAISVNPTISLGHQLLAELLILQNKPIEAEKTLQSLLMKHPADARGHALLAHRYESNGRFDEAEIHFWHAIEADPNQGYPYYALVSNRLISHKDRPLIARMESILLEEKFISDASRAYFHFALGKAQEDLGEFESAMKHYDQANKISLQQNPARRQFDCEGYSKNVDRVIETFSSKFMCDHQGIGSPNPLPIFIVGMMRSGSTLVEQILSAHPGVIAGGENPFWKDRGSEILLRKESAFTPHFFKTIAAEYLKSIKPISTGYIRVSDKMPGNYGLLGLIQLAFPNAKIIHTLRNPIDTCLSIYANGPSFKVSFANDKSNIVFAYRQYLRIMDHWRSTIPPESMLEIDYEDVVNSPETVAKSMVSFCGLEWNEACLCPQENPREVFTPSAWQVRQPIYTTSVDRRRKFAPWLAEFRSLESLY